LKNNVFIKITNRDIYQKLDCIEKKLGKINLKANMNSALIGLIVLIMIAMISRIF